MSWVLAAAYVGGCLVVMSTFSYVWRRRKAAQTTIEPWFPGHKTRDIYISLLQADPPAQEVQLKSALLRRAMANVERIWQINEDKHALARLVQSGSVGDDLWTAFQAAEKELNQEVMEVCAEANTFKADWGQTIIQTAIEMVGQERCKAMRDEMREMQEREEKAAKRQQEREEAEAVENEKKEKARLEKERKQAEDELLKMDEADKKKKEQKPEGKGKSKKK